MASNPKTVTVATTTTVALRENEYRKKAIFSNTSANTIFLSQGAPQLSTTAAIALTSGSVLIDEPDTRGWIYYGTWFCLSSAGGETLLVDEIT